MVTAQVVTKKQYFEEQNDKLKARNADLERENENLRDMLNDISWRLGLDGRDIDECDRVHYFSEDNYEDCQSKVTSEISSLMDKAGQTLSLTTEDGTVVVKGCTYLLKSNDEPVKVQYVYGDSECCEVLHLETGQTYTTHANRLKSL